MRLVSGLLSYPGGSLVQADITTGFWSFGEGTAGRLRDKEIGCRNLTLDQKPAQVAVALPTGGRAAYLSGLAGGAVEHSKLPLSQPVCGNWSNFFTLTWMCALPVPQCVILHLKFLETIAPPLCRIPKPGVVPDLLAHPLAEKARHLGRRENRWGGQTRLWGRTLTPDTRNAGTSRPPSVNLGDTG